MTCVRSLCCSAYTMGDCNRELTGIGHSLDGLLGMVDGIWYRDDVVCCPAILAAVSQNVSLYGSWEDSLE